MNNSYKGTILILLSALGFSLLPVFALFAYKGGINITTLLFIRFSLSAVMLFVYAFIKYKRINMNIKDLFPLFILGAVCYNLQSNFYFLSVKYIPASLAVLLLYTYPIIVTAMSFFIDRERISVKTLSSIIVSFAGLIMILGTSFGKINGYGILTGLGAAMVYSIYIVLGNRTVKRTPPLISSAFISLFSSAGIFASGLFTDGIRIQFGAMTWFPIVGLVLFSTVLAMLTFFRGMELLGPSKASIISMMEPVFTVIFSMIIFSEHQTILQLAGGILVLAGATSVIWSKGHNRQRNLSA